MALNVNALIRDYKSAGVYTIEVDNSQRTIDESEALRLLVGFAPKGPFNRPVYLETDNDRQKIFGPIDTKLEHKGCFFNRFAQTMLRETPIFTLNLLSVDDSLNSKDKVNTAAMSLDAGKPNPVLANLPTLSYGEFDYLYKTVDELLYGEDIASSKIIPYVAAVNFASLYDRSKFWIPSPDNLLAESARVLGTGDEISFEKTNFLNFANVGTEEISILVFKPENLKGFDITCAEWYGGKENIPYGFIRPYDYIKDYFLQVICVKGNWSNYGDLSSDPIWKSYFDSKGIKKSHINRFLAADGISLLGSWTGIIIPDFIDKQGVNQNIIDKINRNIEVTGLMASFNKDAAAALNYDYNGPDNESDDGIGCWFVDADENGQMETGAGETREVPFYVDMVGHNMRNTVTDDTKYTMNISVKSGNPEKLIVYTSGGSKELKVNVDNFKVIVFDEKTWELDDEDLQAGQLKWMHEDSVVQKEAIWFNNKNYVYYEASDFTLADVEGFPGLINSFQKVLNDASTKWFKYKGLVEDSSYYRALTDSETIQRISSDIVSETNDLSTYNKDLHDDIDPALGGHIVPVLTRDEITEMIRVADPDQIDTIKEWEDSLNEWLEYLSNQLADKWENLAPEVQNYLNGLTMDSLDSSGNNLFITPVGPDKAYNTYGFSPADVAFDPELDPPVAEETSVIIRDAEPVEELDLSKYGTNLHYSKPEWDVEGSTENVSPVILMTDDNTAVGHVYYVLNNYAPLNNMEGSGDIAPSDNPEIGDYVEISSEIETLIPKIKKLLRALEQLDSLLGQIRTLYDNTFENNSWISNESRDWQHSYEDFEEDKYLENAYKEALEALEAAEELGDNEMESEHRIIPLYKFNNNFEGEWGYVESSFSPNGAENYTLYTFNLVRPDKRWKANSITKVIFDEEAGITEYTGEKYAIISEDVIVSFPSTIQSFNNSILNYSKYSNRYSCGFLSYNFVTEDETDFRENIYNVMYMKDVSVKYEGNSVEEISEGPGTVVKENVYNIFICTSYLHSANLVVGDYVDNIGTKDEKAPAEYTSIPGITKILTKLFVPVTGVLSNIKLGKKSATVSSGEFTYEGKLYKNYEGEVIYDSQFGKVGFYVYTTTEGIYINDTDATKGKYLIKQLPISDAVISNSLRWIPMKGLKLTSRHKPGYDKNGNIDMEGGIEKIYGVLAEDGMIRGLCNPEMVDYRYIVDSMSYGIDTELGGKRFLSDLAMKRGKTTAILNLPSKKQFAASVNPYFCKSYISGVDVRPAFDTKYIADGGNAELYSTRVFSLPTEEHGAKFTACFWPNLTYKVNGQTLSIPPAADVANTFIRKYNGGNPYAITANLNGLINNPYVSGVEYDADTQDRDYLEPMGINTIIRRRGNIMIYGNQTAFQKVKSDFNKLHVREILNYIEIECERVLHNYNFAYNTAVLRAAVVTALTPILQAVQESGAIDTYTIVCDETNNTEEVIAESMGIVDINVWFNMGMEKIIQRITVNRTFGAGEE